MLGLTNNITSTFHPQQEDSSGPNVLEGILSLFLGPLVTVIGGLIPVGRVGGALINGGAGVLANGIHDIFGDPSQPCV